MGIESNEKLRILGIDPAIAVMGYGIIDIVERRPRLVEAGVIRTQRNQGLEKRLVILYDELEQVLEEFHPDLIAIEEMRSPYKSPRTANIMGQARAVVLLLAGRADIPVKSYSPTAVKNLLTGSGRATKEQVQESVKRILKLKELPTPPDVADALAVALFHAGEF